MIGFHNVIEQCRRCKINKLIYASSSLIYGSNKKISFSVNDKTDYPVSLYGVTKKLNELVAYAYSHLYGFKTYADIKKYSEMLEFKPKVSLQVGLKRTIDWYESFIGLK